MSLISQLQQSMSSGAPTLDQVSSQSPTFQPGLQPPSPTPMPDKSPITMMPLHRALARRGMQPPQQIQFPEHPVQNPPPPGMSYPEDRGQDVTLPSNLVKDDNPAQPGVQVQPTEADKLIAAITKRLDHHNKMEEKLVNSFYPEQQA